MQGSFPTALIGHCLSWTVPTPIDLLTGATDDTQVPHVCLAPAACSHVLHACLSRRQAHLTAEREGWLIASEPLRSEVTIWT